MERAVGWILVSFMGKRAYTLAILGEGGDEAILGALTLEELELEVDPSRQSLLPMKEFLLLAAA